jgi:hypothetical protein
MAEVAHTDRDVLTFVRTLAKEAAEPGWVVRDYDAWNAGDLLAEVRRLHTYLRQQGEPLRAAGEPERLAHATNAAEQREGALQAIQKVSDRAAEPDQWRHTTEHSLRGEPPTEYLAYSEPAEAESVGASYDPAADWTATSTGSGDRRARAWNHPLPPKAHYTFMRSADLEMRMRENADSMDEPEPVVDEREFEQLALAPPAEDSPQYPEFIWRWLASQQKHRSDKQRAYFRAEAERLLVEVPPTEAARRWNVLSCGRSSGTRMG